MTGCGGLSGEHIELCAEGARLEKPNLSGKRTEINKALCVGLPYPEQSIWDCFFLFRI